MHTVSAPFIWAPLPFILLLDVFIELYHQICFPIYGLEKVKRSDYVMIMDRARLDYLNPMEKINCMYCGYGNGVLLYWKEIAGRTEKYWCGIMHQDKPGFKALTYQKELKFSRYNDQADFEQKYSV
jgi:hypothetical protein